MTDRPYDLIFVAQLIERKQPMFVVEVMKLLPGKSLLVIGTGPLYETMRKALWAQQSDFIMRGDVPYDDIPKFFKLAKIALLPTLDDSWMITANEALAAGCPVITTKEAGCAGDLVRHKINGSILPLDVGMWVKDIKWFLDNYEEHLHWLYPECELMNYTPELAAKQIIAACEKAMEGPRYRETRKTHEAD